MSYLLVSCCYLLLLTERPDVALVCEYPVLDTLESQPLDRHLAAGCFVLVFVDVKKLGEAKVRDLDTVVGVHQYVACSQVSVYKPLVFQVSHS